MILSGKTRETKAMTFRVDAEEREEMPYDWAAVRIQRTEESAMRRSVIPIRNVANVERGSRYHSTGNNDVREDTA